MLPQLPNSPAQIAVLAALLVVAWALGYFASTFEGKWRRRFNDERRFYAQYRDETDRLNIEKTQRIAELETQKNVLSQEIVRLRNDVTTLTEQARTPVLPPTPVPERIADTAPMAAEPAPDHPAEPEPVAPVSTATVEPEAAPTPQPIAMDSAEEPAPMALPIAAAIAAPLASAMARDHENLPHVETTHADDVTSAPAPEAPAAVLVDGPADSPAHDVAEQVAADPVPEEEHDAPVAIDAETAELTRIKGIDPVLAAGLASLGIRRIEDIEKLSAEDEKSIEIHLAMKPGQIANDQWRLQAALIGSGEDGDAEPEMATAEHA